MTRGLEHTTVPVIDVRALLASDADGKRAVGRAIGRACEDIGFFTIVGHGIDAALVRAGEVGQRSAGAPPPSALDQSVYAARLLAHARRVSGLTLTLPLP